MPRNIERTKQTEKVKILAYKMQKKVPLYKQTKCLACALAYNAI